jgi:excisionase family DNA binding protein
MQTIYTLHSLARMLQVSSRTIRREAKENKLASIRIRGRLRFRNEDVQAYIARCFGSGIETGIKADNAKT